MTEVRIYFEGDPKLRSGFQEFFSGFRGPNVRVKPIGCGANAIENFMNGIKRNPNAINTLLIDSEGPYTPDLLRQIRQRPNGHAAFGRGIADSQIHLMVQVMESWFLADKQALRGYYGQGFSENRLPGNPAVEEISKDDVLNGLAGATRTTAKGRYHKTNHASDLLAIIEPAKVRAVAPACDRLFNTLAQIVDQPN